VSGVIILPRILTASGGQNVLVGALTSAGNALRKIGPEVGITNAVYPVAGTPAADLEREFAFWADESLDWAQHTFEAQAEAWPAD
jgi:hypothetical protein